VLKDIVQPNASMNPDHVAYNLELADGELLVGIPQKEMTNGLVVATADGSTTVVPRERIASMTPSPLSLMPEGLADGLEEKALKDLMSFLLIAPPDPAALKTEMPSSPRAINHEAAKAAKKEKRE
jgi:putative heme-binding domain-containing protein